MPLSPSCLALVHSTRFGASGRVGAFYNLASAGLRSHPLTERWPSSCVACSFLPLLQPQIVPYQLRLYAEQTDATVQRVAEIIQE